MISHPDLYKGKIIGGHQFIINGVLNVNDEYFRDNTFEPAEIGWTGIFIGKCPTEESHFESLKSIGIEAVVNLMS